jgi:recombination associated protein RdgC
MGKDNGGFDADVTIATGELPKLIPDLIEALGGESQSGIAAAAWPPNGSAPAPHPGQAEQRDQPGNSNQAPF